MKKKKKLLIFLTTVIMEFKVLILTIFKSS